MNQSVEELIAQIREIQKPVPPTYRIRVSQRRFVVAIPNTGMTKGVSKHPHPEKEEMIEMEAAGVLSPRIITKPLSWDDTNVAIGLLQARRANELPSKWMVDPHGDLAPGSDELYLSLEAYMPKNW